MNNPQWQSYSTFGDLLRFLRQRERLSQRDLAIAVGYSDAQINRLERGSRTPDPQIVAARFIPALQAKSEAGISTRLIELATNASQANKLTQQQTEYASATWKALFVPDTNLFLAVARRLES